MKTINKISNFFHKIKGFLFNRIKVFDKILLKYYIKRHNFSYGKINQLSLRLNNGIHPKHEIMKYHQFFLNNIEN